MSKSCSISGRANQVLRTSYTFTPLCCSWFNVQFLHCHYMPPTPWQRRLIVAESRSLWVTSGQFQSGSIWIVEFRGRVNFSRSSCQDVGCSAAVKHSPRDHEVEGSNLARRFAFFFFFYLFFSSFPSQCSCESPKSGPQGGASLLVRWSWTTTKNT